MSTVTIVVVVIWNALLFGALAAMLARHGTSGYSNGSRNSTASRDSGELPAVTTTGQPSSKNIPS